MTRKTRRPDFSDTCRILSDASLLDFAEGNGVDAAIARSELRARVREGAVNDMDFTRAAKILDLA